MTTVETFPREELRRALKEAGITHPRFAAASGLSPTTLAGVLSGRINPRELARLRAARGLYNLGLPQIPGVLPEGLTFMEEQTT